MRAPDSALALEVFSRTERSGSCCVFIMRVFFDDSVPLPAGPPNAVCTKPVSDVYFTPNSDRKSGTPRQSMSALPPKADVCSASAYVCSGPKADSRAATMSEGSQYMPPVGDITHSACGHRMRSTRISISLRSVPKSIGLVRSARAPFSKPKPDHRHEPNAPSEVTTTIAAHCDRPLRR